MFEWQVIPGDKIVLYFQYAESGLMVASQKGIAVARETPDAELAHFELVDKGGVWCPTDAKIDGKTVVVTRDEVRSPF